MIVVTQCHRPAGPRTYDDLAAEIAEVTDKEIAYTDLTPERHRAALIEAGLPEETARFLVALDGDTRNGLLGAVTDDLRALIGRPATPMADTTADLLAKPA